MRIDKIMFKNENRQLNFIDLFAGAGGLSEGFFQAGFNPIAHVEMNKSASKTLETRSAYYYLKKNNELDLYYQYERGQITRDELFSHIPDDVIKTVINAEMSPDTLPGIFEQIDTILKEDKVSDVDVIIGGPPCQAYSLVGRAQSSHMLTPMEEDPRNELYKMYTRFLTKYQPRMFVFENVAGLLTARGGDAFKNLTAHLKRVGYEIDFKEQNAADFRVLQKRKRIIIIGWRKGTDHFYPEFEKIRSNATVHDLLDDLAPVERGQENDAYRLTYDQCSAYLKENNIRTEEDVVTHHIARPNNDRDVTIYGMAIDAYNRGEKISYDRLPDELKTHRNQTSFKDRFKVVEGNDEACHTVLAHLAKDGHYFIHPDSDSIELVITAPETFRIKTKKTRDVVEKLIKNAEKSVVMTGYSISDYFTGMLDTIIAKSQQGVYVRFYVNDIEKSRASLVKMLAYRSKYLQFFEYEKNSDDKMAASHAKILTIDSDKSLVSSANLSYHGLSGNIEMGFLVRSADKAKQIEELLKELVRMHVYKKIS